MYIVTERLYYVFPVEDCNGQEVQMTKSLLGAKKLKGLIFLFKQAECKELIQKESW